MLRYLPLPLALSAFIFLGCKGEGPPPPNQMMMKPPQVKVALPVAREVTDYEDFTGRMEALKSVDVRARATGYLQSILFEDGAEVKEGQALFLIDPRTYKATLAQAEANLRQARAHLQRLNADFSRAQSLLPRRAMSQEDYDKIKGDRDEAEEAVGVAVANRNFCQLNVDYCRVVAPISGRVSRHFLDLGNTVKADDTVLTRIVYLDKMYVYFDINERTFLKLQRLAKEGKMNLSPGGRQAPVLLRLADEKDYTHQGTIDFEDNQLDQSTGTRRLRAVVDNKDRFFTPYLFVRVRLPIGRPHRATLVAEQALATDQGQKFVWVVEKVKTKDGKEEFQAKYRPVEVGRLHDGLREITAGLKPGERVVVRGLQRIRPDAPVTPEDTTMEAVLREARPGAPLQLGAVPGKKPGPARNPGRGARK